MCAPQRHVICWKLYFMMCTVTASSPSSCERISCLVSQTTYMLGLVFIRIVGTIRAHALRYWQPLTAHSTSIEANITNHLLLSDGSAPASAFLAFNHSHLISPFLYCPRKDSLALSTIKLGVCCLHGNRLFHTSRALIGDTDVYHKSAFTHAGGRVLSVDKHSSEAVGGCQSRAAFSFYSLGYS